MPLFFIQCYTDIRLVLRHPAHIATLCATALTMYLLLRFGLPPRLLLEVIPALLLAVLTMSILHLTHANFVEDAAQDRLSHWHYSKLSIEWMVLSRWFTHMLATALPLVACFAFVLWVESGELSLARHAFMILLEVASMAIASGLMTGALVVCFRVAAGLAYLLSLPFLFSVVIFAAQALLDSQSTALPWVHGITLLMTPALCWITAKLL